MRRWTVSSEQPTEGQEAHNSKNICKIQNAAVERAAAEGSEVYVCTTR